MMSVQRGYVFVDVCLGSGHFGRFRLVSGFVRRCPVSVGTCSARSAYSRDVFGEVGLGRYLFIEVGLVSVHVQRGRVCVGT